MLTLDRWLAVLRPLYFKKVSSSRMVSAALLITPWLAGFSIEYTSLIHTEPVEYNNTYRCSWKEAENLTTRTVTATFGFLIMIFIPAILMALAYIHIVLHLRKLSSRVTGGKRDGRSTSPRGLRALKRITCTAILASSVVVLCWFPDQVYYALSQVGVVDLNTATHATLKIVAFSNSCINPFIYSFSNRDYRRGFKELLCCKTPTTNTENSQLELSIRSRADQ